MAPPAALPLLLYPRDARRGVACVTSPLPPALAQICDTKIPGENSENGETPQFQTPPRRQPRPPNRRVSGRHDGWGAARLKSPPKRQHVQESSAPRGAARPRELGSLWSPKFRAVRALGGRRRVETTGGETLRPTLRPPVAGLQSLETLSVSGSPGPGPPASLPEAGR